MTVVFRRRIGVARFDDGWNVVVELGGVKRVYDPTYPTEAEALAQAENVKQALDTIHVRISQERER